MIFKKKIDEDTQFEINQLVLSIADLDKQNKKIKNIIDSKDKKIDELKERLSVYESDTDTVVMTKEKWEETKQELERLTKRLEESQLAFLQVDKERQRLNNIINELEEYSKDRYYEEKKLGHYARLNAYKDILDKLQELKGVDKE